MATRLVPVLVLLGVLVIAQPAMGRTGQPLADIAPATTVFAARVLESAPKAGVSRTPRAYAIDGGGTMTVSVSASYGNPDPLARSYVDFLDSLLHGDELSRPQVRSSPRPPRCSGPVVARGRLRVTQTEGHTMVVPGERPGGMSVTTSYIVAHEYGHHIAAFRSHAPFEAIDYGPKRWSSQKLVCARTLDGRLAPGDERENYLLNPGESWAETYAQLKYRNVRWAFSPLLRPTAASRRAARRDVTEPWTASRRTTFSGELAEGADRLTFTFKLRLDGAARFVLDGPDDANFEPPRRERPEAARRDDRPRQLRRRRLQRGLPRPQRRDDPPHGAAPQRRRAVQPQRALRGLSGPQWTTYGFDLVRALGEVDGMVTSEGTIYPLLSRLRRDGLVETTWRESIPGLRGGTTG